MSLMDRLLEEAIPLRPLPPADHTYSRQEQDRHWRDLCNAVGSPGEYRPGEEPPRRRRRRTTGTSAPDTPAQAA